MDKFEEYYKNSLWYGTYESDLMMREAYEAGQQSQQAKVEELKRKNRKLEIQILEVQQQCGGCDARDKRIEELQKRVDKALEVIMEYYTGSYDESPDLVVDLDQALKGGE